MTTTDYLINIGLVGLVILQIRGSRLNLKTALRPVICVAAAALYYLQGLPTSGNDVLLDLVLGGAGAVLGVACAMTTRVWKAADGHSYAKAGVVAAALWVIGIGSRLSGVRERVKRLGGDLVAGPAGPGWSVVATVPA
jgi:hypothetical protein